LSTAVRNFDIFEVFKNAGCGERYERYGMRCLLLVTAEEVEESKAHTLHYDSLKLLGGARRANPQTCEC
jgi:hypothetical protein